MGKILKLTLHRLVWDGTHATGFTEAVAYVPAHNVLMFEPLSLDSTLEGLRLPQPAVYLTTLNNSHLYVKATCEEMERMVDQALREA